MSKISDAFQNKNAFVAYLMGGDPDLDKTRTYIMALEKAGADIIEIGIPFSDPVAEGEVIQRANLRALAAQTNTDKLFEMVKSLKDTVKIPLLFMTYLNPVFRYGYDAFFQKCAECGISGVIIPDLPIEEQEELHPFATQHQIEIITLIAPTSKNRIELTAKQAQGFIYMVSSMGVTGIRSEIQSDVAEIVAEIKRHTPVPVAIGFGVHTPEQAKTLSKQADGIIVGSAIVKIIEEQDSNTEAKLTEYVQSMKQAMQ